MNLLDDRCAGTSLCGARDEVMSIDGLSRHSDEQIARLNLT